MATTTATTIPRRVTRRKSTTPRTASSKGFSTSQMIKDAETPLTVGVGVLAGKFAHDFLTRGASIAGLGDTADTKKATSLLQPAILIALGLSLPQLTKNKYAKNIGAGVALYGGVTAAKNYTNTDVLGSLEPNRPFAMNRILGLGNPGMGNPQRTTIMGNPQRATLRLPAPPPNRILGVPAAASASTSSSMGTHIL